MDCVLLYDWVDCIHSKCFDVDVGCMVLLLLVIGDYYLYDDNLVIVFVIVSCKLMNCSCIACLKLFGDFVVLLVLMLLLLVDLYSTASANSLFAFGGLVCSANAVLSLSSYKPLMKLSIAYFSVMSGCSFGYASFVKCLKSS